MSKSECCTNLPAQREHICQNQQGLSSQQGQTVPIFVHIVNMLIYSNYGGEPIGINYEGEKGNLYISISKFKTAPASSYSYDKPKYSPAFCVKKDGTATIRWFSNADALQKAMNACDCIIASAHPLVFGGECIVEKTIYDNEQDSLPIYIKGKGKPQEFRKRSSVKDKFFNSWYNSLYHWPNPCLVYARPPRKC